MRHGISCLFAWKARHIPPHLTLLDFHPNSQFRVPVATVSTQIEKKYFFVLRQNLFNGYIFDHIFNNTAIRENMHGFNEPFYHLLGPASKLSPLDPMGVLRPNLK